LLRKLAQHGANSCAEPPFSAVAVYRVFRDPLAHDKADTRASFAVGYPGEDEQPGGNAVSLLPHSLEITIFSQA